jgi:hypothetical protein
MALSRLKALVLLSECDGDHIWSIEHCRERGVPEEWITNLVDGFESGFDFDDQTIYYQEKQVNQFEGIRDYDLALRLAKFLGINISSVIDVLPTRRAVVQAIKEKFEEG